MIIPISEIFLSIQGEWKNTWKPSVFVRFRWCNLKCERCDSKYSRQDIADKKNMNLTEVINKIRWFSCKHIVFTWWEPALFENIIKQIVWQLFFDWYTYEIETNWFKKLELDHLYSQVNVSYKLSSSWNKPYELKALSDRYDYKFVIDTEEDMLEMEAIINKYNLKNIYIMPLWVSSDTQNRPDIIKYCIEKWYNYCQRLHILLFWNSKWC